MSKALHLSWQLLYSYGDSSRHSDIAHPPKRRRSRCKDCKACRTPNCEVCIFCRDKAGPKKSVAFLFSLYSATAFLDVCLCVIACWSNCCSRWTCINVQAEKVLHQSEMQAHGLQQRWRDAIVCVNLVFAFCITWISVGVWWDHFERPRQCRRDDLNHDKNPS